MPSSNPTPVKLEAQEESTMSVKNSSIKKPNLSALKENWKCPFVAREEVGRFSGGILNPRTMANHDHSNEGPKNRIRIGRKVVYPTGSLVEWLEERAVFLDAKSEFTD